MLASHTFTTYSKSNLNKTTTLNSKAYNSNEFLIYFLNKEVFYTKLKYSRVPQFDTASGAIASFLSGLYGFMVCEKFGFELIDSGDFFFMVIYLGLLFFLISLLTSFFNASNNWGADLKNLFNSFRNF